MYYTHIWPYDPIIPSDTSGGFRSGKNLISSVWIFLAVTTANLRVVPGLGIYASYACPPPYVCPMGCHAQVLIPEDRGFVPVENVQAHEASLHLWFQHVLYPYVVI